MNRRFNLKVAFAGLTLTWVVLIVGMIVSRSAAAQPAWHSLEPPFAFVPVADDTKPEAAFPPPGSTVIMTETFRSGFSPIHSLAGTDPVWRAIANPTDAARYYWDRVASGTYSNTAWSATTPITTSPPLTPGVSPYPSGQDTWLIFGPINLSRFQYVRLTFEYYLDSEPGDTLIWGASYDGQTFYGSSQGGGHISDWLTGTLQLAPSEFANNMVYIGFAFQSGASPSGRGAFIRSVSLTGVPLNFIYMPAVLNNYPPTPTPTPTPIPLYGYTFDEPDPRASGSDLSKWGGKFDGSHPGDFGPYAYGQDVRVGHGNPKNSLTLYTTASFVVDASSPTDNGAPAYAPTNFDLYVDTSPWHLFPDNRYGIVFGASDSAFGVNPSNFNPNANFYLLYFSTGNAAVSARGIRLDRCSGGNCTRLSGSASNDGYIAVPPNFVGNASAFDTVHLQRDGSTITVWVNDVYMFSLSDGTYLGSRKWGVFILPYQNDPTYPPIGQQVQVDFDNIRIYSR